MAKVVQLRRGTTAELNAFTGMNAEVTVDTTKKTIRVHDGSTQGGTELARTADIPSVSQFLSLLMPVGYVYISANSTSPLVLFGFGTWERITGRFLLGADTDHPVNSTGGSATHTITSSEMPSHNHGASGSTGEAGWHSHGASIGNATVSAGNSYTTISGTNNDGDYASGIYVGGANSAGAIGSVGGSSTHSHAVGIDGAGNHTHSVSVSTSNTGGGQAMSILNPYIAVYMWKRTA